MRRLREWENSVGINSAMDRRMLDASEMEFPLWLVRGMWKCLFACNQSMKEVARNEL